MLQECRIRSLEWGRSPGKWQPPSSHLENPMDRRVSVEAEDFWSSPYYGHACLASITIWFNWGLSVPLLVVPIFLFILHGFKTNYQLKVSSVYLWSLNLYLMVQFKRSYANLTIVTNFVAANAFWLLLLFSCWVVSDLLWLWTSAYKASCPYYLLELTQAHVYFWLWKKVNSKKSA